MKLEAWFISTALPLAMKRLPAGHSNPNPSSQEAEAEDFCEFKTNLVYVASSQTASGK